MDTRTTSTRRSGAVLALTALTLLAGLAAAGPAAAVVDPALPDARVTHGPSCDPGGIVVEVVAGAAPHAVVLATTRTPDGEDLADVRPGETVVLRTAEVAWGETVDGWLEYRALDGSGDVAVDDLEGYTFTRPSAEDCAAITAPAAPATVPGTAPEPEPTTAAGPADAPVAQRTTAEQPRAVEPGPAGREVDPGGPAPATDDAPPATDDAAPVPAVEVAAVAVPAAVGRESSGIAVVAAAVALGAAAAGLGSALGLPGLRLTPRRGTMCPCPAPRTRSRGPFRRTPPSCPGPRPARPRRGCASCRCMTGSPAASTPSCTASTTSR